ncbi:MAG: cytochrome b/b6 domain-containing protein, partial [Gammaproteobacteria bacterium]|nr:cytochrome b/b6 domain-containing protein [Gammaproteobacteria bacterium]
MEWTITFDDQSLYVSIKQLHISTGVLLCLVLPARIAWRVAEGWKDSGLRNKLLRIAALAGPVLLLALISAQAMVGLFARWTDKNWETGMAQTLPFFGMFEIPAIFDQPLPDWNHWLEDAHEILEELIIAMLLLHIAGAVFHWITASRGTTQNMAQAPEEEAGQKH